MDRPPVFHKLTAHRELLVLRRYPRLVPRLMEVGLGSEDALAVAYNATLLFYAMELDPVPASPKEILERFSLGEIAALCRLLEGGEAGELDWGYDEDFGEVAP